MISTLLPVGLKGLVLAALVAAIVSSLASMLNSISTIFTMDIYIKQYKPEATNMEITRIGRFVVLVGALLSIFLAIGITYIQGLSFFNIFQSVLGFIAPPMSVAFLFAVLWKKTSPKAINSVLTLGTMFSIGTGILYYNNLIFNGLHFLYISFIIFIILSIYVFGYSVLDKKTIRTGIAYTPIRIDTSVKIAWLILVLLMVGLYLFFN